MKGRSLWGKKLAKLVLVASIISIGSVAVEYPRASAQMGLGGSSNQSQTLSAWVSLEGDRVIQVSAPSGSISERRSRIEKNLAKIFSEYMEAENSKIEIEAKKQTQSSLPEIYINGNYLMTVTQADAKSFGTTPWGMVKILKEELPSAISRAAEKARSPEQSLIINGAIATGVLVGTIFLAWGIRRLQRKPIIENAIEKALNKISPENEQTTEQLQKQLNSILKAKHTLLPAARAYLWTGSILIILRIFPLTRPIYGALSSVFSLPLTIGAIAIVLYVIGRIVFVAIDRFVQSIIGDNALEEAMTEPRRKEQRGATISEAGKSVTKFGLIGIGVFFTLSTSGVGLGFLLAAVGTAGIIISLAARDFIKDSVNGLFFILEDQFALDDIIVVENIGVGGIVENMTLRITQLRDTKGRLISIPNGQIEAVSNYTYRWCRADLKITVPYDVDINKALDTISRVAEEMKKDEEWSDIIIEEPNLLGIDDFDEWRAVIRLWIKVKPMKLWAVAREYRRRLMLAFEEVDLNLPIPEHKVHFQQSLPLDFSDEILGKLESSKEGKDSNNNSNNNSQKIDAKKERQYANNKAGYGASGEEAEANTDS